MERRQGAASGLVKARNGTASGQTDNCGVSGLLPKAQLWVLYGYLILQIEEATRDDPVLAVLELGKSTVGAQKQSETLRQGPGHFWPASREQVSIFF